MHLPGKPRLAPDVSSVRQLGSIVTSRSFMAGAAEQTAVSFRSANETLLADSGDDTYVMNLQGLFCTRGAVNDYGTALHKKGLSVLQAPNFGPNVPLLATSVRLGTAAQILLHYIDRVQSEFGGSIERINFTGHSAGPLIPLMAYIFDWMNRERKFTSSLAM